MKEATKLGGAVGLGDNSLGLTLQSSPFRLHTAILLNPNIYEKLVWKEETLYSCLFTVVAKFYGLWFMNANSVLFVFECFCPYVTTGGMITGMISN